MRERPILFSSEMVRAILKGRKTQTRRIIKPQLPDKGIDTIESYGNIWTIMGDRPTQWMGEVQMNDWRYEIKCPYGKTGDSLWVRESLRRYKKLDFLGDKWTAQYIATDTAVPYAHGAKEGWCGTALWQWKNTACPSIHMPRWACRIILQIVNIRVERLQDISEADAFDEGSGGADWLGDPIGTFMKLWDSINAKRGYPWESNPWVWVIDFERLDV